MDTSYQGERAGPVRPAGGSREGAPRAAQPDAWVLGSETHRQFIGSLIATSPPGWVVRLDRPTRTYLQNRYLHALLNDLVDQLPWPKDTGELHDLEWWKRRCTLQWLIDMEQPVEIITDLDGKKKFGLLLPHTSDLNTAECAELCEWIIAFGSIHGVTFREPAPK